MIFTCFFALILMDYYLKKLRSIIHDMLHTSLRNHMRTLVIDYFLFSTKWVLFLSPFLFRSNLQSTSEFFLQIRTSIKVVWASIAIQTVKNSLRFYRYDRSPYERNAHNCSWHWIFSNLILSKFQNNRHCLFQCNFYNIFIFIQTRNFQNCSNYLKSSSEIRIEDFLHYSPHGKIHFQLRK